jgi:hypothetical protein
MATTMKWKGLQVMAVDHSFGEVRAKGHGRPHAHRTGPLLAMSESSNLTLAVGTL